MKNNYKSLSDRELIDLVRNKSKSSTIAFEEIYNRYSKKIYTFCINYLNYDKEKANDIFQDVFEKFYEYIIKSKNQIDNILAFLLRVARNSCLNEVRKVRNRDISIDNYDFPITDSESIEQKELYNFLHLAIESLPKDYKDVIIMKEFMDLSYNEIANALNIDISIVRIRIFRAKQKIKDIMLPYINELEYKKN